MSTDSAVELALDQKFRTSCKQIAEERRSSLIGGNIEAIVLLMLIALVVVLLRYAFWGAGFSEFSTAQHDTSVAMLKNLSGPHRLALDADLETKGYISLADYKKYMEMAQQAKARQLRAKPAVHPGSVIVDRTTDVDRAVYASEEEALESLYQQGLVNDETVVSAMDDHDVENGLTLESQSREAL